MFAHKGLAVENLGFLVIPGMHEQYLIQYICNARRRYSIIQVYS